MTGQIDKAELRALAESWAKAVRDKNMEGILARHTDDILMFDVPMPFQSQGLDEYRQTWELFFRYNTGGPGSFDIETLHIESGDQAACGYGVVRIFDNRVRLTLGFRKVGQEWFIAHEHHSYPHKLPEEA